MQAGGTLRLQALVKGNKTESLHAKAVDARNGI